MTSGRPFISALHVEGTWDGIASTVDLQISLEVEAKSSSRLPLVHYEDDAVASASLLSVHWKQAAGSPPNPLRYMSPSSRGSSPSPSSSPSKSIHPRPKWRRRRRPSPRRTLFPPEAPQVDDPYEPTPGEEGEGIETRDPSRTARFHRGRLTREHFHSLLGKEETSELPHGEDYGTLPTRGKEAWADPFDTSPPPPPDSGLPGTTRKLGVSLHPMLRGQPPNSPQSVISDRKDTSSSPRKRPVSVSRRPPWRPVALEDTTRKGRTELGTDVAKRRTSQSANNKTSPSRAGSSKNPLFLTRGNHKRSRSVESTIPKFEYPNPGESFSSPVHLENGLLRHHSHIAGHFDPVWARGRRLERQVPFEGAEVASPGLPRAEVEKWLQDDSNITEIVSFSPSSKSRRDSLDQEQGRCELEELGSRDIDYDCHSVASVTTEVWGMAENRAVGGPVSLDSDATVPEGHSNLEASPLPPSPSPSSQAAVPWTSIRSANPLRKILLRGGGMMSSGSSDVLGTAYIETEGGVLYAAFPRDTEGGTLQIEIEARVCLREDTIGGHLLTIPGLPLQNGDKEGTLVLAITDDNTTDETFKMYEKLAYVNSELEVWRLDSPQMTVGFRLDAPIFVRLLRFEEVRTLKESDFEIDYDTRAVYDWASADRQDLCVRNTTLCSLRLRDFLFWAEKAQFALFLSGGPSGKLRAELKAGQRRIHIQGDPCSSSLELEMVLITAVDELHKPFSVLFDHPLALSPFSLWLPKLSRVSRAAVPYTTDSAVDDLIEQKHAETAVGIFRPEKSIPRNAVKTCDDSPVYGTNSPDKSLSSRAGSELQNDSKNPSPAQPQSTAWALLGEAEDTESAELFSDQGNIRESAGALVDQINWTDPGSEPKGHAKSTVVNKRHQGDSKGGVYGQSRIRDNWKCERPGTSDADVVVDKCARVTARPCTGTRAPNSACPQPSVAEAQARRIWGLPRVVLKLLDLFKLLVFGCLLLHLFSRQPTLRYINGVQNSLEEIAINGWGWLHLKAVDIRHDASEWKRFVAKLGQSVTEDFTIERADGEEFEVALSATAAETSETPTAQEQEQEQSEGLNEPIKTMNGNLAEGLILRDNTPPSLRDRIDRALGWRGPIDI